MQDVQKHQLKKKKETKQSKYNFIIMSKFTLSKLLSE